MKDKIIDLINKERLSVDSFEGNTFIYEDCGSFYRMYFFIDKDIDLLKINVEDKDVVVELPFNRVLNEHQILQEKILEKNGFTLERESSQMSVSTKGIFLSNNLDYNLIFKYGNKDECDSYLQLLFSRLNPLFSFLPNREELINLIEKKCIICAYYNNKLAGVFNLELVNNNVWTRHLVVDEAFVGKNIGDRLFSEGHRIYKDSCQEFKSWVDIHNTLGIRVHEKIGYKFDARKANEYVRRTSFKGTV